MKLFGGVSSLLGWGYFVVLFSTFFVCINEFVTSLFVLKEKILSWLRWYGMRSESCWAGCTVICTWMSLPLFSFPCSQRDAPSHPTLWHQDCPSLLLGLFFSRTIDLSRDQLECTLEPGTDSQGKAPLQEWGPLCILRPSPCISEILFQKRV